MTPAEDAAQHLRNLSPHPWTADRWNEWVDELDKLDRPDLLGVAARALTHDDPGPFTFAKFLAYYEARKRASDAGEPHAPADGRSRLTIEEHLENVRAIRARYAHLPHMTPNPDRGQQ